jgi:hypothetical protein
MQTKKIKSIELYAKKWFQNSYGNTYFSCEIYINDTFIHKIEFCYGYGRHYETVALKYLMKNLFSKQLNKKIENKSLWSICDILNIKYKSIACDVMRKKDL